MLNELVKFIHKNIGKNLRSKITDRHTSAVKKISFICFKAPNDFSHKIHYFSVFYYSLQNTNKNSMVNGIKKFSDVTFQSVTLSRIILAYSSKHLRKFFHSFMRSFTDTARKRIGSKGRFKYRIKHLKNCVVKDTIPDSRLMNSSQLRIMNPKSLVRSMFICSIFQISIKVKNILFQIKLKIHNIKFIFLIGLEDIPCTEQCNGRNY